MNYFNSHDKEDAISGQHGYYNQDFLEKKEKDTLDGGYHMVTLVGWDDNYSKDNFLSGLKPSSNGAWKARNSWGTSFGQNGYFRPGRVFSLFRTQGTVLCVDKE